MSAGYIFGYENLIISHNRSLIGITQYAVPALVQGLERRWSSVGEEFRYARLMARKDPMSLCNGVLFKITTSDLTRLDKLRSGLKRIEVFPEHLWLSKARSLNGRIWTYVVSEFNEPTLECPIVQSYVDVVLSGCLDMGSEFTRQFLYSTEGWGSPFVDDRRDPKCPDAGECVQRREEIDDIMEFVSSGIFGAIPHLGYGQRVLGAQVLQRASQGVLASDSQMDVIKKAA